MDPRPSGNVLVIEGPAYLTGAYEVPLICSQFADENTAFANAMDLQAIARSSDLAGQLLQAPGESTTESRFSGAAHILANEVIEGGYSPVMATLADVFGLQDNRIVPTAEGRSLLKTSNIVALSTTFITTPGMLSSMLWYLRNLRKCIIIGGAMISKASPAEMERYDFDYALSWEAEGRLCLLLAELKRGAPRESVLHSIPGAWWRRGRTLTRALAPYAPIDFQHQRVLPTREFVEMRDGFHCYEAVRGCPFRCEFCDYPFLMGGKKPRFKSAEWIFEEWQALYELGVRRIQALDSLFTVPHKRMAELNRLLIESGLAKKLKWSCFARSTELSNRAFVESMKEAGCDSIHIGIESGSQTILDNMNKRTTVDSNLRAMENCNAVGIPTGCTLVVGFPGETEATFNETLSMLEQHSGCVVAPLVWYPVDIETSKVPILQPDRIARFDIKVEWGNHSITAKVWGKDVTLPFPVRWSHKTMETEQAVHLAARIADCTRQNLITGHDAMNSPYIGLITYGMRVYEILGYENGCAFLRGFRERYVRFLEGEDPATIRDSIPQWLQASGLPVSRETAAAFAHA